ncbi:hypothetical protein ACLB2K_040719 [Fragaria x ananassa]
MVHTSQVHIWNNAWIPNVLRISFNDQEILLLKNAYWTARGHVWGSALATTSSGNTYKKLWKRLWKTKVPVVKILLIYTGIWMLEQALYLKPEAFEKLVMVIWGLWKNRNAKLWEDKMQTALDKSRIPAISAAQQTSEVWSPASTLKLNVDGAYLEHRQNGGVGGILRNSSGNFIAAYTTPVMHISSDLHVELLAIREGIDLIQKMQLQQVVIETDCLQAVNGLYSSAPNMSSLALAV